MYTGTRGTHGTVLLELYSLQSTRSGHERGAQPALKVPYTAEFPLDSFAVLCLALVAFLLSD